MGTLLFLILLITVIFLASFAVYMFVRILKIYTRARRLETMRGYETILYAALQQLSPDRTLQTLLPDPDHKALEEVLLRMGDEAGDDLKEKVIELYRLSGFTRDRVRQLHSRLKSRRGGAARSLGRIGDPGVVGELAGLLHDPSQEVREAALFALGRIGNAEALENMLGALANGNRWSQEKVAEAIEEAGDDSRRVLVRLLADENPSRRAFAAEIMGGIGGEEETGLLVKALRDEAVDVRARAAESLGRMRSHAARTALLQVMDDEAWEVRAQAVKALGRIGEAGDAPRLALALRDREWWVRGNAAAALREMGEAGERPLIEMLWDDDRFAREAAAQALEEGSIVERLVKDMREGGEGAEAAGIIRRLAEIGSTGTIIQVLSDLPESEVKARLVGLLAGSGDAELERALAEGTGERVEPGARAARDAAAGDGGKKDEPPAVGNRRS